jgi:hypothetical protein
MKPPARALIASLPFLLMLPATSASAQNVAAADALFKQGKEEMAKKNYKVACPSFRESYRLDPVPGALHALALCHLEAGEIASAVVRFDEYLRAVERLAPAQQTNHAERANAAREQRAALAAEVPELTLVLPPSAPPGTRVVQDSVELSAVSLGIALPIDPGEHVVTTQAPNGPEKEHRFTIQKGEKKRLDLTIAEPKPAQEEPPRATPEPIPPQNPPTEQGKAASGPGLGAQAGADSIAGPLASGDAGPNSYRLGAFVAGGIGAAALLTGIVTGALAAGSTSAIESGCRDIEPGRARCTPEGLSAAESAQSLGLVSTIGFVIGGAGLATGALLFVMDPSKGPSEGHGRRKGAWARVGLTSAGPSTWMAGVKGAW